MADTKLLNLLQSLKLRCGYVINGYGEAKSEAVEMERLLNEYIADSPREYVGESKQIAYVDPKNPGIVRLHGGDEFDGILAGTRAQMIVDALNRCGISHGGA